jgi:hypothetical protein
LPGDKKAWMTAATEATVFGGQLVRTVKKTIAEKLHWAQLRRFVGFLQPTEPMTVEEVLSMRNFTLS